MICMPRKLLSLLLLAFCPYIGFAENVQTISSREYASATAAGFSMAPVISTDGSKVAFLSTANDLVTNDDTGLFLDVFAYDTASKQIRLVSKSVFGPAGGNGSTL